MIILNPTDCTCICTITAEAKVTFDRDIIDFCEGV